MNAVLELQISFSQRVICIIQNVLLGILINNEGTYWQLHDELSIKFQVKAVRINVQNQLKN